MVENITLKAKRNEAVKIVNEIKEQSQIIENNFKKSKGLLSEIVIDSRRTKKTNNSLDKIIESTENAISRFRKERDRVSTLLTQVNNFYEKKYLPLLAKIEDEDIGFRGRLKQGTQFKNEINKIKESSKTQFDEVKKYAVEIRKSYKEIAEIDNSIRKLLQNSTDKNTKINEYNSHISHIDSQITKTHKSIENLFIISQKNEKSINELLSEANKEVDEIGKIRKDSKQLLLDIQDIYEIAAETGLSGEFDKRRAHLKDLLKKWEGRIFYTTLSLLVLIITMFLLQLKLYNWDLTNQTFDINFYVRFLIASPIVYYLYFCSSQYNQTKKLHDKYSFKTTLATSIKAHMVLLTGHEKFNDPGRINKILEFILDGFRNIYTEPHTNDDIKLKFKLANMEMDIEKRLMDSISKTTGYKSNTE